MKNIKTIVVDLDRTLLRTDKTISPYTVNVLRQCKENKIGLMVATARPLRDTKQFCDIISFDAMVVSNGARIVCGNQQIDYGISQTSAKRLLSVLKGYPNLRITLETGDCAYSNYPISDYETVISNDLERIAESKGVLKILVHIDDNDTLDIVRKEITEDLYYTVAHGYLIQIMSKYATKWNGIKAMLDISNGSPEETAYFGDDYDDIEPIEVCGVGVAVSNGIDAIKSKADYIAKSNDEDGVAIFIEEMLFKK